MTQRTRVVLTACWAAAAFVVPGAAAQTTEEVLARPARLDVRDVSLEEALRALQRSSGVTLAYSPDLLPADARVSCSCAERAVSEALDALLTGTGLVYRPGRRQILIGRSPGVATDDGVVGIVVDSELGRPVPGAEVRIPGGPSALSGDDGRFRLPPPISGTELEVSSLGYEPRTVRIGPGDAAGSLRVPLDRRPIPLREIVIAPGSFGVLEGAGALSGSSVSRDDIEAIPQFGDDVFRTLKRMPGVAAEDISTKLNVRGGTDRDLLVHLDGLELHEPYHLKDLDGALGIVDVQALGRIDLVTGGFPAEYGDETAGVFNMYSRSPPPEGRRTTLGLSLSSVSAISQGSFAEGKGQWLVSLRRGFLEYVLAVAGVEDDMEPKYWDALGRIQHLLGERHLVWVEVLWAGDDLRWYDEDTSSEVTSDWSNGYVWTGWTAEPSDRLRVETLLSVGRLTRSRLGDVDNPNGGAFTPLTADVADEARFELAGAKQDWSLELTDRLMLKAGLELRATSGSYDYGSVATRYDLGDANDLYVRTDTRSVSTRPEGRETGGYAALRGLVGGRFSWEAGLRHDWRGHTGDSDWSPRLLGRIDLGDRTSVKGSWGRYHQSQGLHELAVQDGQTTFVRSEVADQIAVGVEHRLSLGLDVRIEGYLRSVDDPLPLYVNLSRSVNPVLEVESDRRRIVPAEARARGVELIVAYDGVGAASGSASYALARAEDLVDGAWAPRTLDQLHTLNLRGAVRFGGSWQLSASWSYHTGWPFTHQYLDLEVGLSEDGSEVIEVIRRGFGPYNAERLPAYHRLDLRLTRAWDLRSSRLELFLDVFNAYDRTNLRGYEWYLNRSGGRVRAERATGEEQLPILPTLGMRWVF